jgi:hypothetical protein
MPSLLKRPANRFDFFSGEGGFHFSKTALGLKKILDPFDYESPCNCFRFVLRFIMQHSTMAKVAFITGSTGRDGAYLNEFLLKKRLHNSWVKTALLAGNIK